MELSEHLLKRIEQLVESEINKGWGKNNYASSDLGVREINWVWFNEYLKEEIINCILRLTTYPENSIIPLVDLLDKNHSFLMEASTKNGQINHRDLYLLNKSVLNYFNKYFKRLNDEGLLPIPYLEHMKAFERKEELTRLIIELNDSMKDKSK